MKQTSTMIRMYAGIDVVRRMRELGQEDMLRNTLQRVVLSTGNSSHFARMGIADMVTEDTTGVGLCISWVRKLVIQLSQLQLSFLTPSVVRAGRADEGEYYVMFGSYFAFLAANEPAVVTRDNLWALLPPRSDATSTLQELAGWAVLLKDETIPVMAIVDHRGESKPRLHVLGKLQKISLTGASP